MESVVHTQVLARRLLLLHAVRHREYAFVNLRRRFSENLISVESTDNFTF